MNDLARAIWRWTEKNLPQTRATVKFGQMGLGLGEAKSRPSALAVLVMEAMTQFLPLPMVAGDLSPKWWMERLYETG